MTEQVDDLPLGDPLGVLFSILNEAFRENPGEYLRDDDKIAVDILDRQFK